MSLAFIFTHHSITDSSRTTSCPESSIHGKSHIQVYYFFILRFTIPFLYLDMLRYPSTTIVLPTLAYSIQYSDMLYSYSLEACYKLYHITQMCSRLHNPGLCKCTLYVHTMKFNFLMMHSSEGIPIIKQHMTMLICALSLQFCLF